MGSAFTHLALHVRDVAACIDFYQHYAGMKLVHERTSATGTERVVWLAEPGRETQFVLVLFPGGPGRQQDAADYSHLGFALETRAAVDDIANRAREAGILAWEPQQEPFPVGYYCALRDPDGNVVEFSYGQPLGPGAPG